MRFTAEDVERMIPGFNVFENDEGTGITIEGDAPLDDGALGHVPKIIRAALSLKLEPEQFVDNSTYSPARYGSTWTGKYCDEEIRFDVTFLYAPPSTGPGDSNA
jgi:hypothetical protein